ncbi:50S ribosomal protein L11 [[Eubacterium] cellulosolvens]
MGEKKQIEALIEGGKATAGPPLGPALGPLGVNVLMIVNKINDLTKDYAGMKVPVKIFVDVETKGFEVEIGTPTTSALLVKELGVEKGSGNSGTENIGNLTIDQIIQIAKMRMTASYAKTLKSSVNEVLGACQSMGITIEGKTAKDFIQDVNKGEFDTQIQ